MSVRHEHRRSYDDAVAGHDRQIVARLAEWLRPTVTRVVSESKGRVLDVGCGEQPLRQLVEDAGGTYVGFDIEQNTRGSTTIIGAIDGPLPHPWPDTSTTYDVVLCTEVIEHVANWRAAFDTLRQLTKPGGALILTVPFAFPLHMEPADYFRTTKFALPLLAREHRFEIVELRTLGDGADVLLTVLDDLSILPATRSLPARLSARAARAVLGLVASQLRRRGGSLAFNSNFYLSNAAVLRAI